MKINKVMPTKQSTGQKRKLSDPNAVQIENKPLENKVEKAKKAPLKAEIISNLKALEKENEELKEENQQLKKEKIVELEEQANTFSTMNDLMLHKKKTHVDICWNFSNGACLLGMRNVGFDYVCSIFY